MVSFDTGVSESAADCADGASRGQRLSRGNTSTASDIGTECAAESTSDALDVVEEPVRGMHAFIPTKRHCSRPRSRAQQEREESLSYHVL